MFAELNLINSGNCIIVTDGHMSEGFPLNFNFPELDIYNTTIQHYQQWINNEKMDYVVKDKRFDINGINNLPLHCNIQLTIGDDGERFVIWNIGISSDRKGNLGRIEFHENYISVFANTKWDDSWRIGDIANWLLRVLIGNNCENIDVRPSIVYEDNECDMEEESE